MNLQVNEGEGEKEEEEGEKLWLLSDNRKMRDKD